MMAKDSRRRGRGVEVGAGRVTDLRRRTAKRAQRETVLIDTNGKSTEKDYFNALKAMPWVQAGRIVVIFTNKAPVELVRDASRRKTENDFDQAWAVCDVDEFEIEKAAIEARRKGVGLVLSNPCFEVWLILHLTEQTSHLDNADKACERIGKLLGKEWDKSALDFSDFEQGIAEAIKRAKLLESPPSANPSTDVWKVLEAIGYTES